MLRRETRSGTLAMVQLVSMLVFCTFPLKVNAKIMILSQNVSFSNAGSAVYQRVFV